MRSFFKFSIVILMLALSACGDGSARYKSKGEPGNGSSPSNPAPTPNPSILSQLPNPPTDNTGASNPFVSTLPFELASLEPKCSDPSKVAGCIEALTKIFSNCHINFDFRTLNTRNISNNTEVRYSGTLNITINSGSIVYGNYAGNIGVMKSPSNNVTFGDLNGINFARSSLQVNFPNLIRGKTVVSAINVSSIGIEGGSFCIQTGPGGIASLSHIGSPANNLGESLVLMGASAAARAEAVSIQDVNGDVILINARVNSVSNVKGKLYLINSVIQTKSNILGGEF